MIEASPGCVVGAYQALLQLLLVSLDVFSQLCLGRESLSTVFFDVAFESLLYRYTLGQAGAIENIGAPKIIRDYYHAVSVCLQFWCPVASHRKLLFKIKAAALSNSGLLLIVPSKANQEMQLIPRTSY